MADKNGSTVTEHHRQPTTDKHGQPTPLQSADKKTTETTSAQDGRRRRFAMLLFTANAGTVIYLWMVGIVHTGAVIRTLERRFNQSINQHFIDITTVHS